MLPKPSANSVTPVPKIVHIRLIKTFVEAISHSLLVGKWLEKEAMEGHASSIRSAFGLIVPI
jgi:hypothetical protein